MGKYGQEIIPYLDTFHAVYWEVNILPRRERPEKFTLIFNGSRVAKYRTHFDCYCKMWKTFRNDDVLKNSLPYT